EGQVGEWAGGGGLGCALKEGFPFGYGFVGGVEVAFGGADVGIGIAQAEEARDAEGHGEFQELGLAEPGSTHVLHGGWEAILLVGMGSVDQHHAGDLIAVEAGVEADVVSAHGVADEDDWTG